jgi:hypothetical protein
MAARSWTPAVAAAMLNVVNTRATAKASPFERWKALDKPCGVKPA